MLCPSFRVRLFLSVDLVGSTAFKSGAGKRRDEGELYPQWVTQIRSFYRQFPEHVEAKFNETSAGKWDCPADTPLHPQVWKTVGDELLFCCAVRDVEHLACCTSAFLEALKSYGQLLQDEEVELDVKGAGWIATFPGRNKAVNIFGRHAADIEEDYPTEKGEASVDARPGDYDFLGTELDAGFRVAQNASADSFVSSVELAWLLARASHLNIFSGKFSFRGRKQLKGVLGSRSYPLIDIETERSASRREVRARERLLINEPEANAVVLADYLCSFMNDEGIELPRLSLPNGSFTTDTIPQSYLDFVAAWELAVKSVEQQDKNIERASSEKGNEGEGENNGKLIVDILEEWSDTLKLVLAKRNEE
jgi:hypothetical protein